MPPPTVTSNAKQLLLVVLTLTTVQLSAGAKFLSSTAGPFRMNLERTDPCPVEELTPKVVLNISISPFDRSHPDKMQTVSGTVNRTVTFDDSWWVSKLYVPVTSPEGLEIETEMYKVKVRIDKRSDNEWKLNTLSMQFPNKACSTLRAYAPQFLALGFDVKPGQRRGACTFPPGSRSFTNAPLDLTFSSIPVFPYGHWRAQVNAGSSKKPNVCMFIFAHVIPK